MRSCQIGSRHALLYSQLPPALGAYQSCPPLQVTPQLKRRCSGVHASIRPGQNQHIAQQPSDSHDAAQRAIELPSWPSHPLTFFAAFGGLIATIADLFSPFGARWTFQNIDQPTHQWIFSHIPRLIRDSIFEIGLSNISLLLASAGWAVVTGILLSEGKDELKGKNAHKTAETVEGSAEIGFLKVRALRRLAVAWILYITAGGFIIPGDNLLVSWLKHACERVRPSTIHKSFSFPSGHTASATFLVGTMLLVLLPAVLDLAEARSRSGVSAAEMGLLKNESLRRFARGSVEAGGKIWVFAIVSTAVGRVLGDVHWVTDTAAGAFLGIALVSGFLMFSKLLDKQLSEE